jgi:hydroxyacylglutathione hydrolase
MNLVALPAFTDNSIWMLHNGLAPLVDPGDAAAPAMRWLDGLEFARILVIPLDADDGTPARAALRPWKNEIR